MLRGAQWIDQVVDAVGSHDVRELGVGIGGQPDDERRPDSRLGLHRELPTLGLDQLPGDREAEPMGRVGVAGRSRRRSLS